MTDKELLELAAKAAELPECGWMGPAFMYVKDNRFTDWNPLTDDGDALRLAVTLKMDLLFCDDEIEVVATQHPRETDEEITHPWSWEELGNDPYAATRRAVVRAAAEIGKAST